MAMMALGLFVFDLPTLTYQQLQRRTSWRHAFGERVGARPAGQYLGEGDDDITLTGMLAPVAFGDAGSLDDLRTMGKSGEAWPLVDGAAPSSPRSSSTRFRDRVKSEIRGTPLSMIDRCVSSRLTMTKAP